MIRRSILQPERDQHAVKWSLMAAAFALSVGFFAEVSLARAAEEGAKVVAERAADVEADRTERTAG
jgi:hypothetical protein